MIFNMENTDAKDKRVQWLQYINTTLLTVVLALLAFNNATIYKINEKLIDADKESVRLKAVQDVNVRDIADIKTRVGILEITREDEMRKWIDDNYVRKAQAR
jgi:hypothetical protein